ncbi:unnamed protein product, partial [Aphanomyces euteiches]
RVKTRIGQVSNDDCDKKLKEFSKKIREMMQQEGIEVVHNADQTAIKYDYLPTKTLNGSDEKMVWVKCGGRSKERAIAMVLGDSSGRKYPLFLVMKTTQSRIKHVVKDNLDHRHGFGRVLWKQ